MVDSWKHNLAAQATNQVAIGAYWKKYQEEASYLELALYASILPALNFSLLSSLAQNFLSERTPLHLLVSDFLQSSLCTPIGQGVYEIYPDVKQNLRQALSESDPDNQITYRLAHFIDYYVKEMGEEIPTPALEEALTWTSKIILNPTSFAEDLLRNQEREQYATVKYMVRLVRSLTTSGKTLENGRRSALTVAVQFIEGMNQFDLENSLEANRALKALGPNISLEAISQSEGFKTEVPLELWEQLQNRDNELNILESLPPEIRSMDQDSIRAYLESIQTMPTVSNYEANVYILGDAGVGKTSLIRILENHINPSSESWEPTSDRDSAKWFFPLDEGHALYAEPVSFGGQFLLHGGYKLILRPHSLYIIMVDDRRDADRSLRNWIEVTQKYGKDEGGTYSPIMIIQNNKRSTTASLNLENIEKEYPNLQIEVRSGNIIDLSNKLEGFLNNRLDRIANDIRDTLLKLPSIGARIPLAWQGIQEELEKQKERNSYISFQEFWKICREHNLMREADVKILADYLHTKGSIGYYKHIQGLEEVIILNIGWIWEIYTDLMDHRQLPATRGIVNKDFLFQRLTTITEREKELFLSLVSNEDIRLLLPIASLENMYVLPFFVPNLFDNRGWSTSGNLPYKYRYKNSGPDLPYQILAKLGKWIAYDETENPLISKDQFELENEGGRARLNITNYRNAGTQPLELTITLEKSDDLHKEFLMEIRAELADFHAEVPNAVNIEHIPCICNSCISQHEPKEFYNLQNLEVRLAKDRMKVECSKSFEMVKIEDLIFNLFPKDSSTTAFRIESKGRLEKLYRDFYNKKLLNNRQTLDSKVRDHLSKEEVKAALTLLKKHPPSISRNKRNLMLLLESQWNGNEEKYLSGLRSEESYKREIARIKLAVLNQIPKDADQIELEEEEPIFVVADNKSEVETNLEFGKKKIYFSYSWRDDSNPHLEEIVDRMYEALMADGFPIIRDKVNIDYGQSIADFMEDLGRSDLVIAFISDKYLKSEYSMIDLLNLGLNNNMEREKIFKKLLLVPVDQINLTPIGFRKYRTYWKARLEDWNQVASEDDISVYEKKRLTQIKAINDNLGEILSWILDLNSQTPALLSMDDFATVKRVIRARLS